MYKAELGRRIEMGKKRKERNVRMSLCLIVLFHFLGPFGMSDTRDVTFQITFCKY